MELEKAVEKLEQRLQPQKYGGKCVLGYSLKYCFGKSDLEAIETVLKYIKEESIPIAVVEEKIKEVRQLENASIADLIESEKEFCIDILQEILTKGE